MLKVQRHCLIKIESKKWILSINKFVEKKIKEMSAEDPEHNIGDKVDLNNLIILKCSKKESLYGTYFSIMTANESGWKYHFSSSKLSEVSAGDKINISGKVKEMRKELLF